ncbi:hypothetical protein ACTXGU_00125 [Niallia sp. 01092]|uniref:hypothetical protein n=1 Tax=Niallia sp. 01092 TaxID=3457759 RepID=UPI003FCF5607
MIKESLYFIYNGRKSSDFGVVNVSMQTPLTEHLIADRKIYEMYAAGKDKPYFSHVRKEPLMFDIFLYFEHGFGNDKYSNNLLEEIEEWLDVDEYKILAFESNLDVIYYAMPYEEVTLFHDGLGQGYLQVPMKCNSPYKYSHVIKTPFYNTTSKNEFEIMNKGRNISPTIEIKKIGDGDLKIYNKRNYTNPVIIKNLKDSDTCRITKNYFHIDNFDYYKNDYSDYFNYRRIEFAYGNNEIVIEGSCYISFTYQFEYT